MVTRFSGGILLQLLRSLSNSSYSPTIDAPAARRGLSGHSAPLPATLQTQNTKPWMSRAGWDAVLEEHARRSDAELAKLPSNVLLLAELNVMTIWDGYEKAKFHFLVLRELLQVL